MARRMPKPRAKTPLAPTFQAQLPEADGGDGRLWNVPISERDRAADWIRSQMELEAPPAPPEPSESVQALAAMAARLDALEGQLAEAQQQNRTLAQQLEQVQSQAIEQQTALAAQATAASDAVAALRRDLPSDLVGVSAQLASSTASAATLSRSVEATITAANTAAEQQAAAIVAAAEQQAQQVLNRIQTAERASTRRLALLHGGGVVGEEPTDTAPQEAPQEGSE